jgi:hypothetical protein
MAATFWDGRSLDMLKPVMVLVLWSLVMWAWLYSTRIPASMRARIKLHPGITKQEFDSQLPMSVRWKADNYNHLMEQPTIFYATALALAVLGTASLLDITLAWIYVALRVAHSLVQALSNVVIVRFGVFTLATLTLVVLAISATMQVFAN